jgi:hypothetical protein
MCASLSVSFSKQELNSSVTSCDKARRGGKIWWQYCTDWNELVWIKSVLGRLVLLGIEKVSFGQSIMAWNGGSQFWPNCNSLEWRKLVLTWLEWLGTRNLGLAQQKWHRWEKVNFDLTGRLRMEEVSFDLPGMSCNVWSRFWPYWNGLE